MKRDYRYCYKCKTPVGYFTGEGTKAKFVSLRTMKFPLKDKYVCKYCRI